MGAMTVNAGETIMVRIWDGTLIPGHFDQAGGFVRDDDDAPAHSD